MHSDRQIKLRRSVQLELWNDIGGCVSQILSIALLCGHFVRDNGLTPKAKTVVSTRCSYEGDIINFNDAALDYILGGPVNEGRELTWTGCL